LFLKKKSNIIILLKAKKLAWESIMTNVLVTKSNHLVEAGYKLSLNEQRLILAAITQLDGRKPFPKDNAFVITAAEFSAAFNIPINQAYETLDDAASRLYERDIKTFDKNAKTRDRFRWVDCVKYWDGEAKVTLSFSNSIRPYLTLLHQQFTTYELKQVSQLRTAYSIRFYELLVQFIKTGERYITLEKLREILEIKNQYPRFYDLKKYIIEPSVTNINISTNLTVEWDAIKNGRTIVGLLFVFENSNKR
jgi:plasmid replication initiation protein